MTERISIDFEVLHGHGRLLDSLADSVGGAVSAAASQNVSGGAFGVACAFLVPPIELVTSHAESLLAEVEQLLLRGATQVREMASDFSEQERLLAEQIRALEGQA